MARGVRISQEVRAQIVAALLQGQEVTKVAEQFSLPHSTVSRLKKEIPPNELDEVGRKKKESFANLIADYVSEGLTALTAQLREVGKPEYIKRQDAASLATLHGVINDKLVRLLSAFEPAGEEPAKQGTVPNQGDAAVPSDPQ
jgi:transposase-like protein